MNLWLNKLEVAYQVAIKHRIVLVIDIHHPSWVPDTTRCVEPPPNGGDSTIQNETDFVNKWSEIAQWVVNRGHNRDYIWYDLCNEPKNNTSQGTDWRDIALRAAQTIRRYDDRSKIVFAAPGTTTTPARSFAPLPGITKQVLQFHFYNWGRLQGGVTPAYPSGNYTQENLRRLLQEVSDAGKRHSLPVYIGEVAINQAHPNAPRFLRDFTSICDQLGIHLTIHAYREADIWNYENNPRAWQILTSWLQRR